MHICLAVNQALNPYHQTSCTLWYQYGGSYCIICIHDDGEALLCLEIVYFLWWLTVPEYNSELSSISVSLSERKPPSPEEIEKKQNFFYGSES